MRLGLYTFGALTLVLLVGAFVYMLELGSYRLEAINVTLPITIWVVLPLILLFLFTLVHMFYYGMKNYFQIKKWKRDAETLEDALYWSLVNEPKVQKYATDEIKHSAAILGKSSLAFSENVEGLSPRLSRVVNIIQKIKSGEYVDLKAEKMSKVFNLGNPILMQNRLNCLESDEKFVESVMKARNEYTDIVQKEALSVFARKANFEQARKYIQSFNVENFLVMLNRVTSEDDLGLNKEMLTLFMNDLKLTCRDYIKVAQVTKKYFKPDENLALFNAYQKENEKAQNAYLYLLFEYELLDQANKFLEEQEENEFIKFRALYQLKRQNSKYRMSDIIDIHSVCSESTYI